MTRRLRLAAALTIPVWRSCSPGEPLQARSAVQSQLWIQFALATPVLLWPVGLSSTVPGSRCQSQLEHVHTDRAGSGRGVSVQHCRAPVSIRFSRFVPLPRRTDCRLLRTSRGDRHPGALGQVLELRARGQTSSALRASANGAPKTRRVLRPDGAEEDVSVSAVHVGDKLRVRPGEAIPVDGKILEGSGVVTNR